MLKADKANYNALVFYGKCASELGQADQAHAAYQKAIESDNTQPLAWQVKNHILVKRSWFMLMAQFTLLGLLVFLKEISARFPCNPIH